MSVIKENLGKVVKVTLQYVGDRTEDGIHPCKIVAIESINNPEPPIFARNLIPLYDRLCMEGPYANDETEAFLFQCALAIELKEPFTLEEQHELVRLANVYLKPNPFSVRYPEYLPMQREAGVITVGPIRNSSRKPWMR